MLVILDLLVYKRSILIVLIYIIVNTFYFYYKTYINLVNLLIYSYLELI